MANNFFKTVRTSIKNWYILLIIGILLILLGIYVINTPITSYLALSFVFSWSFLVSGILEIAFAVSNQKELDGWGWYLTGGIFYALFGVYLLVTPEISLATLPLVVAFYIMFKSFQLMSFSFDLKSYGSTDWGWLTVLSILGILFSFILFWNPLFAGLSLVVWTGIAIITAGIAASIFAFQLKKLNSYAGKIPEDWKARYEALKNEYNQHVHK